MAVVLLQLAIYPNERRGVLAPAHIPYLTGTLHALMHGVACGVDKLG